MSDEIELLIAANCSEQQFAAMTYEVYKDGIGLTQPTTSLVELVRLAKQSGYEQRASEELSK